MVDDIEALRFSYINVNFVWIFLLPRPMDNIDFDVLPTILIKIAPILTQPWAVIASRKLLHKEVHIEKIVENPTFFDQRISNDIFETECINVIC